MIKICFFFVVLFFQVATYAARTKDVSIMSECLWNKELFYKAADCNDLFHHYPARKLKAAPKQSLGKVRIGSFNTFRMGLKDTRFKDYNFIGKVVNSRWDVVALSELQHNMSAKLAGNVQAIRAYSGGMKRAQVRKAYMLPGYLRLLAQMQRLDTSWGLLLTAEGQGHTQELFGFLYRKSVVRPIGSQYCASQLKTTKGKPLALTIYGELHEEFDDGLERYKTPYQREFILPKSNAFACRMEFKNFAKNNFARIPFVGRFRKGNFDFSLVSLHSRFRAPGLEQGKCLNACEKLEAKMIKAIGISSGIADLPGREIARFFEAHGAITEAARISKVEKDRDIIIAGDFNLENGPEATGGREKIWNHILKKLPRAKTFIESKTSISRKVGLSQNYDHFIFAPGKGGVSACDAKSVRAVDFTSKQSPYSKYFKKVLNKRFHQSFADRYLNSFDGKFQIFKGILYPLWLETRDEVQNFVESVEGRDKRQVKKEYLKVTQRKYIDCRSGESKKGGLLEAMENDIYCRVLWQSSVSSVSLVKAKDVFRPHTELVSDHIPIEMTCKAD